MDKNKFFKYAFGCSPDSFPETIIITPFIPLKMFKEHCEITGALGGFLYSGFFAKKKSMDFAVIRCGMGDRFLGDAILLLGETNVKEILFTGACGGLGDEKIGNIFVCENAFDGEGFTRYHRDSFDLCDVLRAGTLISADSQYTGELEKFLSEKIEDRKTFSFGNIFTIGSILAEDKKTLKCIEAERYKGIDLELSAVYHAANIIGCRIAGLLYVSDLPLTKPLWEITTDDEKQVLKKALKEVVKLAVDFVSG